MRRRTFMLASAASLGGLAGCSSRRNQPAWDRTLSLENNTDFTETVTVKVENITLEEVVHEDTHTVEGGKTQYIFDFEEVEPTYSMIDSFRKSVSLGVKKHVHKFNIYAEIQTDGGNILSDSMSYRTRRDWGCPMIEIFDGPKLELVHCIE